MLHKRRNQSARSLRRSRPVCTDPQTLQQAYITATRKLGPEFFHIDAWLADHKSELWEQIHQADEELFALRDLGTRERTYQDALAAFIELCQEAERLYYETHPNELTLPQLGEGETVAVYFELTDGSLHKVSGEDGLPLDSLD